MGSKKSEKVTFFIPLLMKSRKEIGSASVAAIQPVMMPQKSAANVSSGSMAMQAITPIPTAITKPDVHLFHTLLLSDMRAIHTI